MSGKTFQDGVNFFAGLFFKKFSGGCNWIYFRFVQRFITAIAADHSLEGSMKEIEVPTEHLHEHMERHAEESKERWILGVALSSAFLAAFAAGASLMASHSVNEAVIGQIKAAETWNYYQAKGIKAIVLASKIELLKGFHKPVAKGDLERVKQYTEEQSKISEQAKEDGKSAAAKLSEYKGLANGATLFQISIAVGAIAALTRRKPFWYVSLGFGGVGVVLFGMGLLG
jgi:hypothetical protein